MFLTVAFALAILVLAASIGVAVFSAIHGQKIVLSSVDRLMASQTAAEKKQRIRELTPLARNRTVRQALQTIQKDGPDEEVKEEARKALSPPTNADPAAPLLSILPRWVVSVLAVCAFILVFLFLYVGFSHSDLLQEPMARFIFACSLAFAFGVFFFVFYPQDVQFLPPGLDKVSRLAGPPALFLIIAYILLQLMPSGFSGRLFSAQDKDGAAIGSVYHETVEVTPRGKDFKFFVVPDSGHRNLKGIYVEFPAGEKQFKAEIKAPFRKSVDVTFTRDGADSFQFPAADKK